MRALNWSTFAKVVGAMAALLVAIAGLLTALKGYRDASGGPKPPTVEVNRASLVNTYWQGKKVYESHWIGSNRDGPLHVWFYTGGSAKVDIGYSTKPYIAQCTWVGDEDPGTVRITCAAQFYEGTDQKSDEVVYQFYREGMKMQGTWNRTYVNEEERCSLERAQ
jgi:hypothetical protein